MIRQGNLTTLIKRYVPLLPTRPTPVTLLTELAHRLEAATSRLEDLAMPMNPSASTSGTIPVAGLAATPISADTPDTGATPKSGVEPLPQAINDFDSLIHGDVQAYVNFSEDLGGLVAEQVRITNGVT